MEEKLFELIRLLTAFQNIERAVCVPGTGRRENDTEHSYNLAMAAWIIITKDRLPLDSNKAVRYALVHDLVELYAGDSDALNPDHVATKAEREAAAHQKLAKNELLAGLLPAIHAYEAREDEEAQFVYALDKILPGLGIILGNEPTWIEHGTTQAAWEATFAAKAGSSPYTRPYLATLIAAQKARPELFADHAA